MAALADSDLQLGWDKANRWYRVARGAPVQPYFKSMAKQTAERVKLYSRVPPPGDPIPIDVSRFDVRDDEPDDEEIREVVRARLKNGRASGASQLY